MLEMQIAFEQAYTSSIADPDKLVALYAPEATAWTPGNPELKGHEALLKSARTIFEPYTDVKMATSRMWTKGNTAVLQWVINGTDKASSKPVSVSGCEVFTFDDDGLVLTDHTYFDVEAILKQTGAYKGQHPAPILLSLPLPPVELHSAKNDATEDANAKAIVAANAAWFKKDDRTFLGVFPDDFVSYDMSENGKQHDKKFMIAGMAAFRKAADMTAFKDVNVLAVEDFTIDESEGSLTQKAAFDFDKVHIGNTKKSATTHGIEIDQWRDGKLARSWSWSNGLEGDTQLGIGPAAPKKAAPATKPVAKK